MTLSLRLLLLLLEGPFLFLRPEDHLHHVDGVTVLIQETARPRQCVELLTHHRQVDRFRDVVIWLTVQNYTGSDAGF